ncbi:MAG: VOC family protein [Nakamurella sp.]
MTIAHSPRTVLDAPDHAALATFYAQLLGWEADVEDDEWAEARSADGHKIAFQQVDGYVPPTWPGQEHPQQMHIDVSVADLDVAEAAVLAIGATKHAHQPGTSFRVFLDPAGHPFCLCEE